LFEDNNILGVSHNRVQLNVRVYTTDFNRVVVEFQTTTGDTPSTSFFSQFGLASSRGRIERKKPLRRSLFRLKLMHHAIEIGGISKATRSFNCTRHNRADPTIEAH